MNEHITQQINALLETIHAETTEAPSTDEFPDEEVQRPARIINVHLYVETPEDDAARVESIVESQTPETIQQDERDDQQEQGHQAAAPQRRRYLVPLLFFVLCTLVGGTIGYLYGLPLLTPVAHITLLPDTRHLTTTSTITIVPGTADAAQQHLAGRPVSSGLILQVRTVTTTGTGHQDAKAATGLITFYNAAPTAQTIAAGTLITGKDGMQVIIDQDVTVPAVAYPTLGQAHGGAHAAAPGANGNIAAGDIYGPCCRLNLSAVNGPFTGGQDARSYPLVTQQDRDSTAAPLKTRVIQQVQTALQGQLHTDETLLTPAPCDPVTTTDHQPGEEAQHVTITVIETCTAVAYQTQAYHDLATHLSIQQAVKRLGLDYSLNGDLQVTSTQTTVKGNSIEVQVACTGIWVYQFDQDRLQRLKSLIAGKSKAEATRFLLRQRGVKKAMLDDVSTLPTDTARISLLVVYTPTTGSEMNDQARESMVTV